MAKKKADVISLKDFKERKKAMYGENHLIEEGELESEIMQMLMSMSAQAELEAQDEVEELKQTPLSALARVIVDQLISLGMVEEAEYDDDMPDGITYDWGEQDMTIDLLILAELLELINT